MLGPSMFPDGFSNGCENFLLLFEQCIEVIECFWIKWGKLFRIAFINGSNEAISFASDRNVHIVRRLTFRWLFPNTEEIAFLAIIWIAFNLFALNMFVFFVFVVVVLANRHIVK